MTPKIPAVEAAPDNSTAPDTDVEYALILSQMIEVAEADPSQLRLAIYEFARTKLQNNTFTKSPEERRRLALSLEAAIAGVEKFAEKRSGLQRVVFRHGGAELSDVDHPIQARLASRQSAMEARDPVIEPPQVAEEPIRIRPAPLRKPELPWIARELVASKQRRTALAIALFCVAAIVVVWPIAQQRASRQAEKAGSAAATSQHGKSDGSASPATAGQPANPPTSIAAQPLDPSIPLPADYGIYLVNGSNLVELEAVETAVPDKRIEMSTPISQVHEVVVEQASPRFLLYRRELASNPPEKLEVRPVARVGRVTSFDARGKPTFSTPASMWIIRNITYDFRVRPVPGRPEMLLAQAKDGALELPAGRYVLALKDRGYDFVVPGIVSDPAQCVERTDAANGSFYSACQ